MDVTVQCGCEKGNMKKDLYIDMYRQGNGYTKGERSS